MDLLTSLNRLFYFLFFITKLALCCCRLRFFQDNFIYLLSFLLLLFELHTKNIMFLYQALFILFNCVQSFRGIYITSGVKSNLILKTRRSMSVGIPSSVVKGPSAFSVNFLSKQPLIHPQCGLYNKATLILHWVLGPNQSHSTPKNFVPRTIYLFFLIFAQLWHI